MYEYGLGGGITKKVRGGVRSRYGHREPRQGITCTIHHRIVTQESQSRVVAGVDLYFRVSP